MVYAVFVHLSKYYNFNHTLYLQVYLYTGTYIRCIYTLDLRFSMYLTTLLTLSITALTVVFIFNVQRCRLHLEPFLDIMGPETV